MLICRRQSQFDLGNHMAHAGDKLMNLSGSVLAINNAPDGSVSVTPVRRRP